MCLTMEGADQKKVLLIEQITWEENVNKVWAMNLGRSECKYIKKNGCKLD